MFVLSACSSPPRGPGPQAASIAASRVHSRESPYRPRLALVEREGDPRRGLALAVYVGTSPVAAAALSLLIEGRILAAGFETAASHSSPSGFIVYALASAPEDVSRFIEVGNRALLAPLTPVEVEQVLSRWRSAPPRLATSPSEAAMAQCSGELVLEPGAETAGSFATLLGPWLATLGSGDAAFAVVGPRDFLDAGADALSELSPWARLGASEGPRFESESVGVGPGQVGQLNLSVALWGAPGAAAVASAERLGEPESTLALRLLAGFPAWQVQRIASNLNRGGACLRIDLQAAGTPPSLAAIAASASDVFDEIEYTLDRIKPGPWVVSKQVLAMEGPHQAAAVAAWQALSGADQGLPAAPRRRFIHYAGPLDSAPAPDLVARALATSKNEGSAEVERARAVEPGQGKFWMLLATPCGTIAEDGATAGTLALALHATALGSTSRSGVTLEPWLNVDAMGILAHSAPATPYESPAGQAERVAETLARALISAGPAPDVISQSREYLLDSLADGPTPSLSLALRQTTANHPSWLEARGTWASLSAISARSAQIERSSFTRGKLRLASLGNHDDAQVDAGERRLLRLLGSVTPGQPQCPLRRPPLAVAGKYRIESSTAPDADAIISVPLPPAPRGLSEEATWTEVLMNRPGGWLHQALLQPGLVSTARARALGGAGAASLVIEIRAVDGKRDEAVAQVRGLLERLRAGAASATDARNARDYLSRREAERQLNPRGRLVDLWNGKRRAPATLESLRALHRLAFEAGREVVVISDPAE